MLGTGRLKQLAAPCAAIGLAVFAAAPTAQAAGWVLPLPRSDYSVRAACGRPAPGRAHCMALQLVPQTAQARAHTHPIGIPRPASLAAPAGLAADGDYGLRPQDLHNAYQLPTEGLGPQTVAVVDAYNDPVAANDLATYSNEFGLPECSIANGCFNQVNERGGAGPLPFPTSESELESALRGGRREREEADEAAGWDEEISLDIETVHAVCQSCHIVLVEADVPSTASLDVAEDTAARLGQEISNSWGANECDPCADSAAFSHPGTVVAAAAGDEGYLGWLEPGGASTVNYPASSPHVVAVGGTRLELGAHGVWSGEQIWNDGGEYEGETEGYGAGGGGCSLQYPAPVWQKEVSDWSEVGCGSRRAVADVAAVADPYTGLAVYDSGRQPGPVFERCEGWCPIGGTSLATPLISATFALAGGAGGVSYPAQTLYEKVAASPSLLHDVVDGSNGECTKPFDEETGVSGCTAAEEGSNSCSSHAICLSRASYDGPSGLGTPNGIGAFTPPAHAPQAATGPVSGVSDQTATLQGSVEPDGEPLNECRFLYGTSPTNLDASVSCSSVPATIRGRPGVEAQLGGLEPTTAYYYAVVVGTEMGQAEGATETFTTGETPPPSHSTEQGPVTGNVIAGTTPSSQSSPPAAPAPAAHLASKPPLRASPQGVLRVRVSCPAGVVRCVGTVSLRTLRRIVLRASGARSSSGGKQMTVLLLASTPYRLAAGSSMLVRLRLSNAARALLAHSRSLRVRALVFARDPAGATHTTQTIITISAPATSSRG